MITERETLAQLLTDKEGVELISTHVPQTTKASRRQSTRPFSAMKERRFRHRFDRHRHISR